MLTKPLKSGKAEIERPPIEREDKGPGHFLPQPAQLGELAFAGHVQHRAAAHEEEALVEDVGEGVGAGAVDGQFGAEADTGDHVADLADDVVGKQAAAVVFEHGVDDAVEGHDDAQRHQDFHAGKTAAQSINGGLGGEGAHEDRAVESGFAVGVRQPGVQRRHGGIEEETDEDQVCGRSGLVHRQLLEDAVKGPTALGIAMPDHARQQRQAARDVHQQITQPGCGRFAPAAEPDQEHGGKGHQFPEQEQGEEISGIDGADGAGDVEPGRDVLSVVFDVHAVEGAQDAHQAHDVAKNEAELVDAAEDQFPIEELHMAEASLAHVQGAHKHQERDEQEVGLLQLLKARRDQREEQSARDQNE